MSSSCATAAAAAAAYDDEDAAIAAVANIDIDLLLIAWFDDVEDSNRIDDLSPRLDLRAPFFASALDGDFTRTLYECKRICSYGRWWWWWCVMRMMKAIKLLKLLAFKFRHKSLDHDDSPANFIVSSVLRIVAGESSRFGGESFFEPRFPFSRCFGIGEAVTLSALSRSVLFWPMYCIFVGP